MRIYPTVIMRHTYLGQLYESGKFDTSSLEETIDLCSELLAFLEQEHIRVIRLGLRFSGIGARPFWGPWHPALRELLRKQKVSYCYFTRFGTFFRNRKNIELLIHPKGLFQSDRAKRRGNFAILLP